MERQGAGGYYSSPPEYWERLDGLGGHLVRFDALCAGEIVASALCLRGDRWLHYHLGATDDAARDLGASNLLLYTAAVWGQEQRLEEFHLGGGAGGRESLFAFKQRFSPEGRREFWSGSSCTTRTRTAACRASRRSTSTASSPPTAPRRVWRNSD